MTNKEAIEILENHNRWRRGDDNVKETDPKLYGMALDKAIEVMTGEELGGKVCKCKQATFTRTVDEDFEPMCGKCGRTI